MEMNVVEETIIIIGTVAMVAVLISMFLTRHKQ